MPNSVMIDRVPSVDAGGAESPPVMSSADRCCTTFSVDLSRMTVPPPSILSTTKNHQDGSSPVLGRPNLDNMQTSTSNALQSSRRGINMTECVPVASSEHVAEIVGRQGNSR